MDQVTAIANQWLDWMKTHRVNPTVDTYNLIIRSMSAAADEPEEVSRWLDAMGQNGLPPNVESIIHVADSYAKVRRLSHRDAC